MKYFLMASGVDQLIERLPSRNEALDFILNYLNPHKLSSVVANACNPRAPKAEDQIFKTLLSCVACSGSAWAT